MLSLTRCCTARVLQKSNCGCMRCSSLGRQHHFMKEMSNGDRHTTYNQERTAAQRGNSVSEKKWSTLHYSGGWGLTSPHSANRKQASMTINNSDCYLTQAFLHDMLMSQQYSCYQGPSLVNLQPFSLPSPLSLSGSFDHTVATKMDKYCTV